LLLSIYKIIFLLDCVIYTSCETSWKKFLKPPLSISHLLPWQGNIPKPKPIKDTFMGGHLPPAITLRRAK